MTRFTVPWTPRPKQEFGLFGTLISRMALLVYHVVGPVVRAFPGTILLGAVFAVCVGVWVHAMLFGVVNVYVLERAAADPLIAGEAHAILGYSPSQIETLLNADGASAIPFVFIFKYLLWPMQFWIVRDVIILGALFGLFQVIPVFMIWWERKIAGRIQSRMGPMRTGGWHGWSQTIADGVKLVFKEDLVPEDADKPLFLMAPYFAVVPSFLAFVALPFGAAYVFRDLDVALVFILAMLGIEVFAVILGGWASNNKWSVYGAMREACQMVSYEIPMGMALMIPIVMVGSLNLTVVGEAQSGGWFNWIIFRNPFAFIAFITYYIASLASCKRAPFDLPESESELVAGFHTEYSGLRWSLFFFAEYAAMFVVSGLATILFLGGWHSPLPGSWAFETFMGSKILAQGLNGVLFAGPIWFMLKCTVLLYVQLWVRWTLPRIRIDQVLYACIQVMLPLTLLLLLGSALWVWADESWGGDGAWYWFALSVNVVLGLIGIAAVVAFIGIAAYGLVNRRRLVSERYAVDALPGS